MTNDTEHNLSSLRMKKSGGQLQSKSLASDCTSLVSRCFCPAHLTLAAAETFGVHDSSLPPPGAAAAPLCCPSCYSPASDTPWVGELTFGELTLYLKQ